jgi:hypothetical protein
MPLHFPLTLRRRRRPQSLEPVARAASSLVTTTMIVKLDNPRLPEHKPFHLSFLDQNVVRVYTQTLSIFPVSVMAASQRHPHIADRPLSSLIRMKPKQPSKPSLADFV